MQANDRHERFKVSHRNDAELLRDLSAKKAELEEEIRQLQAAILIYAEIERRMLAAAKPVVSLLPCA
jgi:hypothetical protein